MPVSSDGMILRTSYKVRFEIQKKDLFEGKSSEGFKMNQSKLVNKQDSKARRLVERNLEKYNSKQSFVEFPIHLMYEDNASSFVHPMDRQLPDSA